MEVLESVPLTEKLMPSSTGSRSARYRTTSDCTSIAPSVGHAAGSLQVGQSLVCHYLPHESGMQSVSLGVKGLSAVSMSS